jgi:DNA-binding PadR family transcriptional regulator
MNQQLLKGASRLLVLSALAKRPMHGYALSEYLKDEMAEAFKFGVGMLYPLLHQLEKEKLIVGKWETLAGADRRVYALTKKGQKQLTAKKAEWLAMTSLVGKMVHSFAV